MSKRQWKWYRRHVTSFSCTSSSHGCVSKIWYILCGRAPDRKRLWTVTNKYIKSHFKYVRGVLKLHALFLLLRLVLDKNCRYWFCFWWRFHIVYRVFNKHVSIQTYEFLNGSLKSMVTTDLLISCAKCLYCILRIPFAIKRWDVLNKLNDFFFWNLRISYRATRISPNFLTLDKGLKLSRKKSLFFFCRNSAAQVNDQKLLKVNFHSMTVYLFSVFFNISRHLMS